MILNSPWSLPAGTVAAFAVLSACGGTASRGNDPADLATWKRFRSEVRHPCTVVKPGDLDRARANIARHAWAADYVRRIRKEADGICGQVTPDWLRTMIEITTPGCVGPCPACRAKGLPWHPNGQWSWSPERPDQLTCRACGTLFPNSEFPETIVVRSKWDPRQVFRYVGGDTFRCFGYRRARPSISGIIRARKVGCATGRLSTLATAYALTGEPRYARAARAVLLRFAETLPHWLVRAGYGYGEYADCDPHVAARRIDRLPTDEIVAPPNRPDRKLYAGYWAASRVGTSGMDGWWVARVTEAYDLTCQARDQQGSPIFSTADRETIERDVLIESAYLAVCDPAINNKSVGNRTGAALVGLCVGQPDMARFGLDGFLKTVNDWFLPDGGTSESAAYALMTMSGIRPFPLAFRDYTEPKGYVGPDGRRIEHFDAVRDTRYGDAWQALLWTLQGDLRHPPVADSYRTTRIGAAFAELLALLFPGPRMQAFLRETAGDTPGGSGRRSALFYRDPNLAAGSSRSRFELPDMVFPYLSQGFLRAGRHGRKALLLLNAGWWGNHHHLDSLGLYFWDSGHELLSDLGYLWDHPDHYQTRRTRAHNLVMIDGHDQRGRARRGQFHLFAATPVAKIMEASSEAYPEASLYRRTCFFLELGNDARVAVDVFRVKGGNVRDYVFHGPNAGVSFERLDLRPAVLEGNPVHFALRLHLDALGSIEVKDLELCELRNGKPDGPNLLDTRHADAKRPPWGRYIGDGAAALTVASAADDGPGPVLQFRATAPGKVRPIINVGLMLGRSGGYTGTEAPVGRAGATYRLRCSIRGDAPRVRVQAVAWPRAANSASDRRWVDGRVRGGGAGFVPTANWRTLTADVTLPSGAWEGMVNLRCAGGAAPWRAVWALGKTRRFSAWFPGAPGETVFVGDGWGQRDYRNTDRGATLPYILRRREGRGRLDVFTAVFAGEPATAPPVVRGTERLPVSGVPLESGAVALAVVTDAGRAIVLTRIETEQPANMTVRTGSLRIRSDARAAVVRLENGVPAAACMIGGTFLEAGKLRLTASVAEFAGTVTGVGSARGASWFTVSAAALPEEARTGLVGSVLFVQTGDGAWRAWPVRRVELRPDGLRLYSKWKQVGFEARPGDRWRLPVTVARSAAGRTTQ